MGYMHIQNLYKEREILNFKRVYALEKVHGTSAHIKNRVESLHTEYPEPVAYREQLSFFSGGEKHEKFVQLFDQYKLAEKLAGIDCVIYGEAYGGSCQKMSDVYGPTLRFVAFDVQINGQWLAVPQAADFVRELGLDFVDFVEISTTIEEIDAQRDRESVQAIKNGMGPGKQREGVVLRPLIEYTKNNGERVIVKHKQEKFRETSSPRPISDEKLKVLEDARAIALEWVTPMRLQHVLDKIESADITKMSQIIKAMVEDVQREAAGEIVWSTEVGKAISQLTATMAKEHFSRIVV